MLVNTIVLTVLLPCLTKNFTLKTLRLCILENFLYFCCGGRSQACRLARTTIQKNKNLTNVKHVGFDSLIPKCILLYFRRISVQNDRKYASLMYVKPQRGINQCLLNYAIKNAAILIYVPFDFSLHSPSTSILKIWSLSSRPFASTL